MQSCKTHFTCTTRATCYSLSISPLQCLHLILVYYGRLRYLYLKSSSTTVSFFSFFTSAVYFEFSDAVFPSQPSLVRINESTLLSNLNFFFFYYSTFLSFLSTTLMKFPLLLQLRSSHRILWQKGLYENCFIFFGYVIL